MWSAFNDPTYMSYIHVMFSIYSNHNAPLPIYKQMGIYSYWGTQGVLLPWEFCCTFQITLDGFKTHDLEFKHTQTFHMLWTHLEAMRSTTTLKFSKLQSYVLTWCITYIDLSLPNTCYPWNSKSRYFCSCINVPYHIWTFLCTNVVKMCNIINGKIRQVVVFSMLVDHILS